MSRSTRRTETPQQDSTQRPPVGDNQLLISAIAPQSSGFLVALTKRVSDAGCDLLEVQAHVMGRELAIDALCAGPWDAIAKLESALQRMERDSDLSLLTRRTGSRPLAGTLLPYLVEVIAANKPGILYQIADFFTRRGVSVEMLASSCYQAAQTGAQMFSAQMTWASRRACISRACVRISSNCVTA